MLSFVYNIWDLYHFYKYQTLFDAEKFRATIPKKAGAKRLI
jgi:hypothetical protein